MPNSVIMIFIAVGCLACGWAGWESWSAITAAAARSGRRAVALCALVPLGLGAVAVAGVALERTDLIVAATTLGFAAAGLLAMLTLHQGVDLERQVHRIHADLQKQQRELLAAEAARRRAQDATDVAKRQFLSNMSHEMRTPLNGVLGAVELLDAGLDSSKGQRRYLDIIDTSTRCLLQLVDNVLDFTRHDGRPPTAEAGEEFRLDEAFEKAWAVMELAARRKELNLSFEVDAAVPLRLHGDSTCLMRILLNLLDNAIKFTEQGSVSVRGKLEDPPVSLRFNGLPGVRTWLRIEVTDTGVGIGESTELILFEPLAQKDESLTRSHGGAGMGLAVSRRLARALDGRIEVESASNVGSTFSLVVPFTALPNLEAEGVPAAQETSAQVAGLSTGSFGPRGFGSATLEAAAFEAARPTAAGPARGARREKRQLLVVDDDPVSRMIAESQASSLGYEVDVVESGQDAIAALRRRVYAAVIMDCRMPGLDGFETTRRLRVQEHASHLPVIAVTAHAREDERERCLAAGMDELLVKPVATATLAAMLDRVVTH